MCKKIVNSKPYELTLVSFTGLKDTVLSVCRKCAYKETYGTKGMIGAMRENRIEEKSN
jgi:F0F1-type ATP synthase assembly protein I